MAIKNYNVINSAAAGWPGGFCGRYPDGGAFYNLLKSFHNEKTASH